MPNSHIGRFKISLDIINDPDVQYLLSQMHIMAIVKPDMAGADTDVLEIWAIFHEFTKADTANPPPEYVFVFERTPGGAVVRRPAERVSQTDEVALTLGGYNAN